ncbi:MAG: terpene cyclase/mutase family protein [Planctomycetes bacterium]|nr:terpene cyclase/mutase family protein [Planctomycetota bacterium]
MMRARFALALLAGLVPLLANSAEAPAPKNAADRSELSVLTAEDESALIKTLKEQSPRDNAIEKAVKFLFTEQQKDGSIGKAPVYRTAMTGLAVMAMMAAGKTPDDPEHGAEIRRAINYVLSQMRDDGYFGHSDNSRMYGHGICTLMLTEAAGMTRDEVLERRLVEACKRAVKLILKAQAIQKPQGHQGGWRYEPNSTDSDLSLTGWQTMALRSAKNIGIEVPAAAIQSAVTYIRTVAHPEGGFAYQGQADHPVLRGIGLLALPVCGVYDAPELAKSTARMLADPPKWQGPWFYYRIYYSSVGMYQMGDEAWNRFYPVIDDLLINHQNADGSWPEPPGNTELSNYVQSPVYSTSMATLALAVHHHLLPIYQR